MNLDLLFFMFLFIYLFIYFLIVTVFNYVCVSAFEQGHLDPWRSKSALIIIIKKTNKPKNTRLKFNLDKLMDPAISQSFQATIGGKFAPLITLEENLEAMTTNFNAVLIETASDILGKYRRKSKPWVTEEILERDLKKK